MVAGPVAKAAAAGPPSWKLTAPHDAAAQGLVVGGFGGLGTGRALFVEFGWPPGTAHPGSWIAALQALAPVTNADGREARATALALTGTGLARMGLDDQALNSFSRPFREGMFQEDRRAGSATGAARPGRAR